MTLKERIVSDASTVFLDTDEYAEAVTLFPGGDPSLKIETTAIVIHDDLEGTREAYGDGVILHRNAGRAVRQSVKLECLASIDVSDTRRPEDLVKLADGTMVVVQRVLGRDGGMQTVLGVRRSDVSVRRPVRNG